MFGNSRHQRRRSGASSAVLLIVLTSLSLAACSDDDQDVTGPTPGPFRMTFSLDSSFQAPHGGQSINIAVLRSSDGVMVAGGDGLVSASEDPSFTFATGAVLESGMGYEVHYWIDSNFGVGTPGVCDTRDVDHQWNIEFPAVSGDIEWTESHDPSATEDVCSTFS